MEHYEQQELSITLILTKAEFVYNYNSGFELRSSFKADYWKILIIHKF